MTEPVLCPERPFPALSACVREDGHDGRCVFCRGGYVGLTFYEATPRGAGFKAVKSANLRPGQKPSRSEAAAIWAVIEAGTGA